MLKFKAGMWAVVFVLAIAHILAALIKELLPLIIVGVALYFVYSLMFKRKW